MNHGRHLHKLLFERRGAQIPLFRSASELAREVVNTSERYSNAESVASLISQALRAQRTLPPGLCADITRVCSARLDENKPDDQQLLKDIEQHLYSRKSRQEPKLSPAHLKALGELENPTERLLELLQSVETLIEAPLSEETCRNLLADYLKAQAA